MIFLQCSKAYKTACRSKGSIMCHHPFSISSFPSSLRPHEVYSLINPEHSRLKLGCTYLLGLKTSSYDQTICFCIHNWRTKEESKCTSAAEHVTELPLRVNESVMPET
jgi:hypothetical protein